MKLILYSGGGARDNRVLAKEALSLLENPSPLIAFIPSDDQDLEEDFADFKRKFTGQKVRFLLVPIDEPLTPRRDKQLLKADAIFLGGGNTFYFLRNLRARGLITKLRAFVRRGGLLMGLSAGSILMTPSIDTASVPSLDADDNDVGVRNFSAMGLVNFEFSPHYRPDRRSDAELLRHSKKVKHPIYACADGNGIVVKGDSLTFVGDVKVFYRGRKYNVQ